MPLPVGLETVTVTGTLQHLGGQPMTGRVAFTPDVPVVTSVDEQVLWAGTAYADLDVNGQFSIELLAADATNITPSGWTIRLHGWLDGPFPERHIFLTKDLGDTADLVDLVAITPTIGDTTTIQGPVGPRGTGWLSGVGPPTAETGKDGDFYIDTLLPGNYYGPRTAGAWGSIHNLIPNQVFSSTGVVSGCVMSFNVGNPAAFDITAGLAYIVDNDSNPGTPVVQLVPIAAQTITLSGGALTRVPNWWTADGTGVITAMANRPTNEERRDLVQLGVTASVIGTGVLFNVQTAHIVQADPLNQLYDLMYELGPFNSAGNAITGNANLTFNKAAGRVFSVSFASATSHANPHVAVSPAEAPATFRYATQLASSQGALATQVDVTHYDVGGVITLIPGGSNATTIHRVWLFATGIATAQLAIQYGQTVYASLTEAQAAIGDGTHIVCPDFEGIGVLAGYIIATKSATSLQDIANVKITNAVFKAAP